MAAECAGLLVQVHPYAPGTGLRTGHSNSPCSSGLMGCSSMSWRSWLVQRHRWMWSGMSSLELKSEVTAVPTSGR